MLPTFSGNPVGDTEGTPGMRMAGEALRKCGLTGTTFGELASPTQIVSKPIAKLPW